MSLLQEVQVRQAIDRQECSVDPLIFVHRHVTIETPVGEVIPFRLWRFQEKTLQTIHREPLVIVLKARRLGLSWIALTYALWLSIFQQGSRCLILCKNEDDASELLDRVRRMRDRLLEDPASRHLFAGLQSGARKKRQRDAVTTLDVGRSVIRALVGTASAARSETASLLILDEFAFQKEAEGIWRAALPTTEGGGRVVAVSTGNGHAGKGAEFSQQWSHAAEGSSGFAHLFWPWDAHPDRDANWRERKERELGDADRARVEYPDVPDDAFVAPDVDLTYSLSGIDAAVRLGKEFDGLFKRGELGEPDGGVLGLGIDWGEHTQAYVIWPLEQGGIYIPPTEVCEFQSEPAESTDKMIEQFSSFEFWVEWAAYDSAGVQSNRTFIAQTERMLGRFNRMRKQGAPNTIPVPFNKYKNEVIGYQRKLLSRAAEGRRTRILAISPKNEVLIKQLRHYVADDKEDDHGPDALTAGIKPIAVRHREDE